MESVEAAVEFLKETEGNIPVTTGSKELHKYTAIPAFEEERLLVSFPHRKLPVTAQIWASPENIGSACRYRFGETEYSSFKAVWSQMDGDQGSRKKRGVRGEDPCSQKCRRKSDTNRDAR
ncbi:MAG: hypothetical protein V8T31_02615 [Lachnospiraceae bacterium]